MENNNNQTNNQQNEKKKKAFGWFTNLPGWGKGLLIGGCVLVLAGTIAGVTWGAISCNSKTTPTKEFSVTEEEFKAAIDKFKCPTINDTDDNRNYESEWKINIKMYQPTTINSFTDSGSMEGYCNFNFKFNKNFYTLKGSMKAVGEAKTTLDEKAHFLGGNLHEQTVVTDGKTSNTFDLGNSNDYSTMLTPQFYDFKTLTHDNYDYSGEFTLSVSGSITFSVPLRVTFNDNKQITRMFSDAKGIEVNSLSTSNPSGTMLMDLQADLTFSNYGSTNTGLKESDFPLKTLMYPSGGDNIDFGTDLTTLNTDQLVCINAPANVLAGKKITVATSVLDSHDNTVENVVKLYRVYNDKGQQLSSGESGYDISIAVGYDIDPSDLGTKLYIHLDPPSPYGGDYKSVNSYKVTISSIS